jgi:hypothetical protein
MWFFGEMIHLPLEIEMVTVTLKKCNLEVFNDRFKCEYVKWLTRDAEKILNSNGSFPTADSVGHTDVPLFLFNWGITQICRGGIKIYLFNHVFSTSGGTRVAQFMLCLATEWTTRRSRFNPRQGRKDFSSLLRVQAGSGAHPASCPMCTGGPVSGANKGE